MQFPCLLGSFAKGLFVSQLWVLISCCFPVDAVPSTTAETVPVSKPLAFAVTSPGPMPASTAPAPASSSLLDSLKKMQSSQAVSKASGEEEGESWHSGMPAELGRCSGNSSLPLLEAADKTLCSSALLAAELAGRA